MKDSIGCVLPTTAAQFLAAIAEVQEDWRVEIVPADRDDIEHATKVVFWLNGATDRSATVEHSHGRLMVCLDHGYWFDVARLHEHRHMRWSWQQQIGEKAWCRSHHLGLLDRLCAMFPDIR